MKTLTGPERREIREFACESKFLLSFAQAAAIESWVRSRSAPDPHGSGVANDHYAVSSLYFDTVDHAVYRRVGSYGRSKYRIRRYDEQEQVFVERKTKTKTSVSKRRSLVPLEDLSRLEAPSVPWSGRWFRRRLDLRGLRPMCQISYSRTARIGVSDYGPYRVTFDRDLRALPIHAARFADMSGASPLLDATCILELKYRYTLPLVFRQLLNEFAPVPQRISKYRLAVKTLGLATDDSVDSEETVSEFAGP